jgi:putative Mg2+ transporter-C (MgtC) family protein
MLDIFDFVRTGTLDWISVAVRLFVAVLCGGFIGIERERKRRPAGFRTHILICLGAAMATLTSQYVAAVFYTDMARLGAQVIAGIGFIGAGTIIVTKRRQVKGLTTAAGLWAAAIVGLCCGAGFIEGALLTTMIIMVVELLLVKIEYWVVSTARVVNLYVEYVDNSKLGNIVDTIKNNNAYINDMEITKAASGHFCAVFTLKMRRRKAHQAMMTMIAKQDGVVSVEEL